MVDIQDVLNYLDDTLEPHLFRDYCPNGLQVQGKSHIQTLVTGVTASQDLVDAAIDLKADAILVHHGYFWKGEDPCVSGMKRNRLAALLKHDINLLAYHLPLDAHASLGNNAQLADLLNITVTDRFALGDGTMLGFIGELSTPSTVDCFSQHLKSKLQREPLTITAGNKSIKKIAWCTGAAQDAIEQAYEQGADAFISGEISERTVHFAKEMGIHYFAAGHHATERYGVKALGEQLANKFQINHQFVDIDNPV